MNSTYFTSILPPSLRDSFSSNLLSAPMPKWVEDEENLLEWANYLLTRSHKLEKCPAQKKKAEEIQQQFL